MSGKTWGLSAAAITALSMLIVFQNCGQFASLENPATISQPSIESLPAGSGYLVRVGEFIMTDLARSTNMSISGRVMMTVSAAGQTEVFTFASGLSPSTAYMAHVHNLPCALGGGAHYKLDSSVAAAVESNEIWPLFTTDANGEGFGHALSPAIARADAQSIVIHDPANAANRLACADLMPERKAVIKGGRFVQLPGGVTAGINPVGSGVLIRNANGQGQTIVRFNVSALQANTAYMAHVHNLPCATTEGGPHYKRNPNVTEATASAANELWPLFTTDANGRAVVQLNVDYHVARPDAASIVIHSPANMAIRLACMDLNTDAGFVTTLAGMAANLNISGWALMTRKTTGKTEISATVSGLTANASYMAHVHDRPCATGGGGHYKKDPTISAAVATNEIWMTFAANAMGTATTTVNADHLVRPEAQSIVIHDPVTPANRLACVDLY